MWNSIAALASTLVAFIAVVTALYQLTSTERLKRNITYKRQLLEGAPTKLRPALEISYHEDLARYSAHIAAKGVSSSKGWEGGLLLVAVTLLVTGVAQGFSIGRDNALVTTTPAGDSITFGMILALEAFIGGHLAERIFLRKRIRLHIEGSLRRGDNPNVDEMAAGTGEPWEKIFRINRRRFVAGACYAVSLVSLAYVVSISLTRQIVGSMNSATTPVELATFGFACLFWICLVTAVSADQYMDGEKALRASDLLRTHKWIQEPQEDVDAS